MSKKRWIILSAGLLIIGCTVFGTYSLLKDYEPTEVTKNVSGQVDSNEKKQPNIPDTEKNSDDEMTYNKALAYINEAQTKALIGDIHKYLNSLAGWGGAESFSLMNIDNKERWTKLKEDISWLSKDGFAESLALTDMENANALLSVAQSQEDSMALRYLHRIFHDYDAEINDQQVDKIWGVTHAFGNKNNQKEVHKFLEGLGNRE
ncbi:hypothetical protein [Metabacillus malikii]|uniref:Uncharacterized protein n=1 Tax=Metabacillus malikii TaxID=1504265 RepID=A0ABT9Z9P4_9BACI|nr:hypothetical protein [Metabacillus malikii]MDQ0228974.1 hypothetical protein [Metabacillus malikii]